MRLDKQPTSLHASIGIRIFPDHARDIDSRMLHADAAVYTVKRNKTQISVYQDLPRA